MRPFAFIIGIIFLIIGIAGFVPHLVVEDRLADVFRVNIWLNTLHVVSGILAFAAGFSRRIILRLYYQIFGILYALLAVLGFIYVEEDILGFLANNNPDTWFHVIIAIACLILGYGSKD
ncbi:MAG: DUF4383 domain-containing protein [Chlamydiales bacterium]|nr:DUF4383 domain-containing protein [Chlamydiales bacterium]